jgi:hypothetical protein
VGALKVEMAVLCGEGWMDHKGTKGWETFLLLTVQTLGGRNNQTDAVEINFACPKVIVMILVVSVRLFVLLPKSSSFKE